MEHGDRRVFSRMRHFQTLPRDVMCTRKGEKSEAKRLSLLLCQFLHVFEVTHSGDDER